MALIEVHEVLLKNVMRHLAGISVMLVTLFAALQVVGLIAINKLMFHPEMVTDGYDATLPGYEDIGTNGVRIAALVRGPAKGCKAFIYCHGNAEDITSSASALDAFAAKGYTVAAVDYPGYGLSAGTPTEDGCYRNVHRLYDWLLEERGFRAEDIVVIGFSIGTGPATELAATRKVGGLVLEAPYLSAPRAVTRIRLLAIDPFPNVAHIRDINCPLLIIHGTDDRIVPFSQGKALFEHAVEPKRFVQVSGAGHVDFIDAMGADAYEKLIVEFVGKVNVQSSGACFLEESKQSEDGK